MCQKNIRPTFSWGFFYSHSMIKIFCFLGFPPLELFLCSASRLSLEPARMAPSCSIPSSSWQSPVVGVGITDIVTGNAVSIAGTEVTLTASHDHGLNRITKLSILNDGAGYGNNSGSAEEHYNARLVGTAGSTTGELATAKVFISAAGNITDVKIMDGGSAYGIGNTMQIVGIPTFTGFEEAVVQVEKIFDNNNNVISVSGITSAKHAAGNQLYKICEIAVGAARTFVARPMTAITGVTTTGIGTELLVNESELYAVNIGPNFLGLSTVGFPTSGDAVHWYDPIGNDLGFAHSIRTTAPKVTSTVERFFGEVTTDSDHELVTGDRVKLSALPLQTETLRDVKGLVQERYLPVH